MQTCLRELAFVSAIAQCHVRAVHIPGKSNETADLLSRWSRTPGAEERLHELTSGTAMTHHILCDSDVFISDRW